MTILSAAKDPKVLATVKFREEIDSTPVAANGTLYIGTIKRLYAIE